MTVTARIKETVDSDFDAFVRAHQADGLRVAYQLLGTLEDARDVVQNALIKAWKVYEASSPRNPRAWFFRIVHNEALNFHRHRRAGRRAEERYDPWKRVSNGDLREAIEALRRLESPYREILNLRFVGGLSLEDVSEALDMPLGTVKVYAARGLGKLRQLLGIV